MRHLALALALAACGDTTRPGTSDTAPADAPSDTGAPDGTGDVAPDGDEPDDAGPDGADTAPDTIDAIDTSAADSIDSTDVPDDTDAPDGGPSDADTGPTPACNGALEPGEACDDDNLCAGDGCDRCAPEPTFVLTSLALGEDGFDLDDADGDGDPTTGVDNLLGRATLIAAALSGYIGDLVDSGALIELATLSGLDDLVDDDVVDLVLHPGLDPECRGAPPFPWLTTPDASIWSDARAFQACTPEAALRDADHPDNGLAGGRLTLAAPSITLPLGPLGAADVAKARLAAKLGGTTSAPTLEDITLGGVVPASALYRVDTSAALPLCPTALHAVLGLAGHLDQDVDGGGRDFVLWATSPGVPCVTAPVVISGCCPEADCAAMIAGEDCALDPRITDGYSAGFTVTTNRVRVTASTEGPSCP